MSINIPVNSQQKPVEYLTRKFAINYNLPTLGRLVKDANRFPALTTNSALAMAALALLKLRVAENGVAQQAGTEWNAELAAAKLFADSALAAVSASHAGVGFFPTPARVGQALTRYATRKGNAGNKWSAPTAMDINAFTAANNAPVAAALTPSVAINVAMNFSLLTGATDAEGDALTVTKVGSKNWAIGNTYTSGGVTFTMAAGFTLTAPGKATAGTVGPIPISVYDGRSTTVRNLTVTVTP